jgi:hypothetical protein
MSNNQKTYVGIDNGVTASWGFITHSCSDFFPVKINKTRDYTKVKKFVSRIDWVWAHQFFDQFDNEHTIVLLERPMVNPGRFTATLSAMRSLESTLCVLEACSLPYIYIDSKEWQKAMLPTGVKGEDLKFESKATACRLFPHLQAKITKHKDGDGILIAEYARRKNL